MRGHRVQNKYTINFAKKIQEAMPRAGLSYKGKALSSSNLSVCFADKAGLRLPASAGRCPNGDSLFPPLAAVVAVAPSRGASGETVHFAGTAKASPTRRGGIALAMTERLYKGKPALCVCTGGVEVRLMTKI